MATDPSSYWVARACSGEAYSSLMTTWQLGERPKVTTRAGLAPEWRRATASIWRSNWSCSPAAAWALRMVRFRIIWSTSGSLTRPPGRSPRGEGGVAGRSSRGRRVPPGGGSCRLGSVQVLFQDLGEGSPASAVEEGHGFVYGLPPRLVFVGHGLGAGALHRDLCGPRERVGRPVVFTDVR